MDNRSFFSQISRLAGLVLCFVFAALAGCRTAPEEHDVLPNLDMPIAAKVYRLRVNDIIQVDVFQEPGLTTRQRIQGDGTISMGLIGRVDVLGETVESAAAKIAGQLNAKYLVNPQVSISVLAYAPRRFTVWGQVNRPGSYIIPPEQNVSLPEAIAMAGGHTGIGNVKKVFVSRDDQGVVKRTRMNALSREAQNFKVEEGDVIFVAETIF